LAFPPRNKREILGNILNFPLAKCLWISHAWCGSPYSPVSGSATGWNEKILGRAVLR